MSSLWRSADRDVDDERARKGEKEERLTVRVRECVCNREGREGDGDDGCCGDDGRGGSGMLISVYRGSLFALFSMSSSGVAKIGASDSCVGVGDASAEDRVMLSTRDASWSAGSDIIFFSGMNW
jgi:hypothetical protein